MTTDIDAAKEFYEVFGGFTEREKNAVYWVIGKAVEDAEAVSHAQCIRLDQNYQT